jgi:peptide/nickel transport system permease protein
MAVTGSEAAPGAQVAAVRRTRRGPGVWHAFVRNRLAVLGLAFLALVAALAVLAPVLPLPSPTAMNTAAPVQPPSAAHPLGTDSFGRDIAARLIWGGQVSLVVGVGSVLIGGLVGIAVGTAAGYSGGWTDRLLTRLMDSIFTFPSLLLAVALVGVVGKGTLSVVGALAVVYIPSFARQARAETLSVKAREFVQAAMMLGASPPRLIVRHIVPNISGALVVRAAAFFAYAVIAESSLSFLGLGAQPPTPTWGGMLSEARPYLERAPWYPMVPGTVIMLTVLALNVVGDAVADALDPRRHGR